MNMPKKSTWSVPRKTVRMEVYMIEAQNSTEAAVLAGLAHARGDKPHTDHVLSESWLGANKVIADEAEVSPPKAEQK